MKVKKIISMLLVTVVTMSMLAMPAFAEDNSTAIVNIGSVSEWNDFIKGGCHVTCNKDTKDIEVRISADLDFAGQKIDSSSYMSVYAQTDNYSFLNPKVILTGWDNETGKPVKRTLKNMNFSVDGNPGTGFNSNGQSILESSGQLFMADTINDLAFGDISLSLKGYNTSDEKGAVDSQTHYSFLDADNISDVDMNNFNISTSNGKKIDYFQLIEGNQAFYSGYDDQYSGVCNSINDTHVSNITMNVANGTTYQGIQGLAIGSYAIANSSVTNYTVNGNVKEFDGMFDNVDLGNVTNSYVNGIKINGTATYVSGFGFTKGSVQNSFIRNITVKKLTSDGCFGGIMSREYYLTSKSNDGDKGGMAFNTARLNNVYIDISDPNLSSPFIGKFYDQTTNHDNSKFIKLTANNVFYTDSNDKFTNSNLFSGPTYPLDLSQFNPQEITSDQLKSNDTLNKLNAEISDKSSTANNWSIVNGVNDGYPVPEASAFSKPSENSVNLTDNSTNISIDAPAHTLPDNTTAGVSKIESGSEYDSAKVALGNQSDKFELYDVNLYSDNNKIEPTGNITVKIPLPDGYNASNAVVYRVESNGQLVNMDATVGGNYIEFATNHFSTYAVTTAAGVKYRAHVQKIGWQSYVFNGQEAGTDGKSLRVEALNVSLTGAPADASITYQAHVQNIGWQKPVSNGEEAGTDGKGYRVEALKFTISGLPGYKIRYRVHVQNKGWMSWQETENDAKIADAPIAGTQGQKLRIEAIQIELVNSKTDNFA